MKYLTAYLPGYGKTIVYMLQSTEYRPLDYIKWLARIKDFRTVMYRRQLDKTPKARLLLLGIYSFELAAILAIGILGYYAYALSEWWVVSAALMIAVALPLLVAYGVILPLFIGWLLVQKPKEHRIISRAKAVFARHPAPKIAVVGSYGKTTAKEMLKTVLSESLRVAATPGNMNTMIGISRFAMKLDGKEQVLIVEMGEERPGDIRKMSRLSRPTMAIITGISEAHLSHFKTIDRTIETIFEVDDFVDSDQLFKNHTNSHIANYKKDGVPFDGTSVDGWQIHGQQTGIEGTSFTMKRDRDTLAIRTSLIGLHIIPVAAAVAAIAKRYGLTNEQVETGFQNVLPFEHRMQPRPVHGAWVIDDTYNGNSEGVKAGLEFLKDSGAKRRVYVTPGLVEQGDQTESIHKTIGKQIAESADRVYLMKNSVTDFIIAGLKSKKFDGDLLIIDDPLDFYQNLELYVAAGDVVLMQNDWTDNYY